VKIAQIKPLLVSLFILVIFTLASCVDPLPDEPDDDDEEVAGWPSEDALQEFLLDGFSQPSDAADIIHSIESIEDKQLYITFTGTAVSEYEVVNYFVSNGWINEGLNSGIYEYSKGDVFVTFDTSNKPFYVIDIGIYPEEEYPGWPSEDVMQEFGLFGFSQIPDVENITHVIWDDLLIIRFSGTAASEYETINYFISNGWVDEGSSYDVYEYSKDGIYVTVDTSNRPYYEIEANIDY